MSPLFIIFIVSGALVFGMFMYRFAEESSGRAVIAADARNRVDIFVVAKQKNLFRFLKKYHKRGASIVRIIPVFIMLMLLSVWMWALRFTIKIVSLLQGRNSGHVKEVVREHLDAISDYKRHLQE